MNKQYVDQHVGEIKADDQEMAVTEMENSIKATVERTMPAVQDSPMDRRKNQANRILAILFLLAIFGFGFKNLPAVLSPVSSLIKSNFRGIPATIDKINDAYDAAFPMKYTFLNINGLEHRILDRNLMNDTVRLDNGYMIRTLSKKDVGSSISQMAKLRQQIDPAIPIVYVQAIGKTDSIDALLPPGITDYSQRNADAFIKGIRQEGIPVLDLNDTLESEQLDRNDMFFKTDHHWKPEAAFWAFGHVARLLNETYGCTIDPAVTDLANYDIRVYPDWFLGSIGKRTGSVFAGVDDISLITPKFETDMTFKIPYRKIVRSGTFAETMLNMDRIDKKDFYGLNPYVVYIGGDYPLFVTHNQQASEDKRILLLGDSFSLPVAAFLSLALQDFQSIDLRHFSDESLVAYVKRTEPDMILFLYNPKSVADTKLFDFFH